ncbi:MAG: hypothetical protein MZU91_00365 [Desulfosudis oleivorans]|nr:hypothetical protein [Desulfosudis oleivorans]
MGQETEKKVRIEGCSRTVFQKYGLDIASEPVVTEGFDPREDDERLFYVNGRIAELGPVNLAAIEEYTELKTRYDFLTAQQKDLTMSIAELEEAISRINSTSRRKAPRGLRGAPIEVLRGLHPALRGRQGGYHSYGRAEHPRIGHRDHRPAAGEKAPEPEPPLGRREGPHLSVPALCGVPHQTEPTLHPRRGGCAPRRSKHLPFRPYARRPVGGHPVHRHIA